MEAMVAVMGDQQVIQQIQLGVGLQIMEIKKLPMHRQKIM
jgi:hypothetical protein